ncbi:MAG TPA: hypothetical protein VI968_01935 [archaeon]|nr:hypothetical protein [archaeon]
MTDADETARIFLEEASTGLQSRGYSILEAQGACPLKDYAFGDRVLLEKGDVVIEMRVYHKTG